MNKSLLYFIALALLSCNSNSRKNKIEHTKKIIIELPSDDDYKIINSTFVHLINPGPPELERSFGYQNYSKNKKDIPEEYITEIYLTQYLASISDSLTFGGALKISNKSLSKLNDLEFKYLGERLISNKKSGIKLDTNLIQNTGLYKVIPVDVNKKVEREIGEKIITYSRIIYNENKNKACFYFENNCSGLCGYATFIFVEKINGIWTIKDEIMDWVS